MTNPLCAVKPAGESKGSVMFLGGDLGYRIQVAFSVHIAEIVQGKEQKGGEGAEEEGF